MRLERDQLRADERGRGRRRRAARTSAAGNSAANSRRSRCRAAARRPKQSRRGACRRERTQRLNAISPGSFGAGNSCQPRCRRFEPRASAQGSRRGGEWWPAGSGQCRRARHRPARARISSFRGCPRASRRSRANASDRGPHSFPGRRRASPGDLAEVPCHLFVRRQ